MDIQALQGQSVYQPAAERVRSVGELAPAEESAPAARAPAFDEYVPEDPTVKQSAGIYQIIHEDDGTPAIQFDAPEDAPPEKGTPAKEAPESSEEMTCNTDKVDRELENLREKRDRLEEQLRAASDDPEKAEKLERELSQVERELQQKDNDAYRRQHAEFS